MNRFWDFDRFVWTPGDSWLKYSDCGRQGSPRVKFGRRVVGRGGDVGVGVPARLVSRVRGGVL